MPHRLHGQTHALNWLQNLKLQKKSQHRRRVATLAVHAKNKLQKSAKTTPRGVTKLPDAAQDQREQPTAINKTKNCKLQRCHKKKAPAAKSTTFSRVIKKHNQLPSKKST